MTGTHTNLRVSTPFIALLLLGSGCREDPLVDSINVAPLANAGPDQVVESGAASVMLDGSGSSDEDGDVVSWRWFSASAGPDGGVALPEGADRTWPEDVANPQVELPEGVWTFSLWVLDERGAVSQPDTVQIQVGNPDPLADPRVAACAMEVVDSVSDPCKACVCSVDDECRTNIVASVCDQTCWDLIDCTAEKCPDFAQTMDLMCIFTNCSEFLASGAAAMAAGRCVVECADICPAMNFEDLNVAGSHTRDRATQRSIDINYRKRRYIFENAGTASAILADEISASGSKLKLGEEIDS